MADVVLFVPFDVLTTFQFATIPLSARSRTAGGTLTITLADYINDADSFAIVSSTSHNFSNYAITTTGVVTATSTPISLSSQRDQSDTLTVSATMGDVTVQTSFNIIAYNTVAWRTIPLSDRSKNEQTTLEIDLAEHSWGNDADVTYSLIGSNNPSYASIDGDTLTLELPAVTEDTDVDVRVRVRRNLDHINIQRDNTITVRIFNYTAEGSSWTLSRGIEQTYDVPDMITSAASDTGWSLLNAPDGVTISDTGIITADLGVNNDAIGTLSVQTNEDEYNVPTTIRDWFPSFASDYSHFFALWRAWNGAEGVDLFEVQIRNATGFTLDSTVTVQSGESGYADIATAVADAPNSSIYVVNHLKNQVADGELAVSGTTDFAVVGYRDGAGVDHFLESPEGRLFMRSKWNIQDFIATGTDFETQVSYYETEEDEGGWAPPWAMMVIAHRRGDSAEIDITDDNSYPGFYDVDNAWTYKFNTSNKPPFVSLGSANSGDWFAWVGNRTPNVTQSNDRIVHRIVSLENNVQDDEYKSSGSTHTATDEIIMRLENYDFAEFAVADIENTTAAQDEFVERHRINYLNQAVAAFFGETHEYS